MLKDKIKIYLPKNDFGFNKKSITERKESYAEYFDIEDNKVLSIDDLSEGMILPGTIRNVVDFGAFVDIGIKNNFKK